MSDTTVATSESNENYFVNYFIKLVGNLLDGLHYVFDDCARVKIAVETFKNEVFGHPQVEARVAVNWHNGMHPYYGYLLDHGVKGFIPVIDDIQKKSTGNLPSLFEVMMAFSKFKLDKTEEEKAAHAKEKEMLLDKIYNPTFLIRELDLRKKWLDPEVNDETRKNLLDYIMHMNAFAQLHAIIPPELMSAAQEKGSNMFDRIKTENMEMNPNNLKQLGTEMTKNLPPEHMEVFMKNMDKFVMALRMLSGGNADPKTLFNNILGPMTGMDLDSPEMQQQSQLIQQAMKMFGNIPPESIQESLKMFQNLPPDTLQNAMKQMQSGEGNLDFGSLLSSLGSMAPADGPVNPWGTESPGHAATSGNSGNNRNLGNMDMSTMLQFMQNMNNK